MKILVVTLLERIWDQTIYWKRSLESMLKQTYDGPVDYLLDRSPVEGDTRFKRVTNKYRRARAHFLAHDYDAMLCVESDMIIPTDAIEKMLAVTADIVYAPYVFRYKPYLWSPFIALGKKKGLSLTHVPFLAEQSWGKELEVKGIGQGCTLIHRRVLELADFREQDQKCSDWFLALDAHRNGLTQVAHLGLPCGHMSLTPRPQILWPDPSAPDMVRIEEIDNWRQA